MGVLFKGYYSIVSKKGVVQQLIFRGTSKTKMVGRGVNSLFTFSVGCTTTANTDWKHYNPEREEKDMIRDEIDILRISVFQGSVTEID